MTPEWESELLALLRDVMNGLRSNAPGRMEWRVGKDGSYVINFDDDEGAADKWMAENKDYCEQHNYRKIHARYLTANEKYMHAMADRIDAALKREGVTG